MSNDVNEVRAGFMVRQSNLSITEAVSSAVKTMGSTDGKATAAVSALEIACNELGLSSWGLTRLTGLDASQQSKHNARIDDIYAIGLKSRGAVRNPVTGEAYGTKVAKWFKELPSSSDREAQLTPEELVQYSSVYTAVHNKIQTVRRKLARHEVKMLAQEIHSATDDAIKAEKSAQLAEYAEGEIKAALGKSHPLFPTQTAPATTSESDKSAKTSLLEKGVAFRKNIETLEAPWFKYDVLEGDSLREQVTALLAKKNDKGPHFTMLELLDTLIARIGVDVDHRGDDGSDKS
tara:strand:- start:238 stop:1110 length:873 start_codon:yes stop_codon:yes gene_type:complete